MLRVDVVAAEREAEDSSSVSVDRRAGETAAVTARSFTSSYCLNSPRTQRDQLDRGFWPVESTPPKVGADINSEALLEVAARLREEGLKKLEADASSALIALRQAFQIQQQYGSHAGDLCAACAALCRVQRKLSAPRPPCPAVDTLCSALDALDAWRGRGQEVGVESDFLWRELWGLSRQLTAPDPAGGPTAECLRAADRCLERIGALADTRPLLIESSVLGPLSSELRLTSEEILFQQADVAQRLAELHMAQSRSASAELRRRDVDAACFFLHRAARKLQVRHAAMARACHTLACAHPRLFTLPTPVHTLAGAHPRLFTWPTPHSHPAARLFTPLH